MQEYLCQRTERGRQDGGPSFVCRLTVIWSFLQPFLLTSTLPCLPSVSCYNLTIIVNDNGKLMSEQLLRTIKKVQREIEENPDAFNREAPTKQSLILPVLNALGWDVFDHTCVHPEFPTGSGDVDWALKIQDKPVVLVEAKSLSTQMDRKERHQLSRYCLDLGVPTALLTNGNVWYVYRPFLAPDKLDFEHRLLFNLRLDQQDALNVAAKLSLLERDEIHQLVKEDLRILLDAYWEGHARNDLLKSFSNILRESLMEWSGKGRNEIQSRAVSVWLRRKMFSVHQPPPPPDPSPFPPAPPPVPKSVQSVILNGEHKPVRYAKDVLIFTAEWLVSQGRLQAGICPVRLGRGQRYLVHTQSRHSTGATFAGPKTLSNGLILETNFSAADCVRRAYELLAICGYTSPEEILQVRN